MRTLKRMPLCFLAALQHLHNGKIDPNALWKSSRNNVYLLRDAPTSSDVQSATTERLPDVSMYQHKKRQILSLTRDACRSHLARGAVPAALQTGQQPFRETLGGKCSRRTNRSRRGLRKVLMPLSGRSQR